MYLQNFLNCINYASILSSVKKHGKLLSISETNQLPDLDWEGKVARPILEGSYKGIAFGTRSNHTKFSIIECKLRYCLVMVCILALHTDDLAWYQAVGSQQELFSLFKQDIVGEFNKESIYRGADKAMGTQERC